MESVFMKIKLNLMLMLGCSLHAMQQPASQHSEIKVADADQTTVYCLKSPQSQTRKNVAGGKLTSLPHKDHSRLAAAVAKFDKECHQRLIEACMQDVDRYTIFNNSESRMVRSRPGWIEHMTLAQARQYWRQVKKDLDLAFELRSQNLAKKYKN